MSLNAPLLNFFYFYKSYRPKLLNGSACNVYCSIIGAKDYININ